MASTTVRHSVCALDCPDACSLLINVDENGRGSKLRGNPDHSVTRGFLCGKVAQYLEREYHPDRLLYPQKRTGPKGSGQFARIGWDEALDTIAANLARVSVDYGPESVLPYSYAGTMGVLNNAGMDRRFFHRLGASRLDRTICSAAGTAGLMAALGDRVGIETEQFRNAKLIIAWGANILGTNVHLWPFIVEARRNGARFYVIDPVKNRTGRQADRHFAVNPGSDLALALGLMHVILAEGLEDRDYVARFTTGIDTLRERVQGYPPERVSKLTGLAEDDIRDLAREYATTRPAAIRLNYGVQRTDRGGSAVQAIALLPALTGAWRDPAGGMQLSTSGGFTLNRPALEMPELQQKSALGREARLVNMSELGSALTRLDNPRVHALVVYNSNPAAIAPDQNRVLEGLKRDDLFTVVLEQFQTDTADHADIVLPVTTFLEHTDLYGAYGHYHLQLARPALPRPGETRPNVEIFRALAQRMGFDDPCFADTEDDMIHTLLSSGHRHLAGITLERLEQEHSIRLRLSENGEPFLPFAEPKRKFDLGAANLEYTPPVESRFGDAGLSARFPLELVASKNDDSMNSTFGYRAGVDEQTAVLEMSGADAGARGIVDGDPVRVFNDRGSVMLRAKVNGSVHKGVVRAPSARWAKRSANGRTVNALTSERLTDMGNGATLYACLVEVERCGD